MRRDRWLLKKGGVGGARLTAEWQEDPLDTICIALLHIITSVDEDEHNLWGQCRTGQDSFMPLSMN